LQLRDRDVCNCAIHAVPLPSPSIRLSVGASRVEPREHFRVSYPTQMEKAMGFGRGLLLWLIGIPLPIIIVLALFMHH
jgi:hypothetical protein